MARIRADFTIEDSVWLRFKSYCVTRKLRYSHVLEDLVKKFLNTKQKKG